MGWKKGLSAPAWVNPKMEKYNNDVIKGNIPCPYSRYTCCLASSCEHLECESCINGHWVEKDQCMTNPKSV